MAFLPILLSTDGVISRGDGLLLLLVFVVYLSLIFSEREYFSKIIPEEKKPFEGKAAYYKRMLRDLKDFFIGLILLVLAAYFIISSSTDLMDTLGFSNKLLFGEVFITLGTMLPSLVFGFKAMRAGHPEMMLGDGLGSVAFNSTAIIGTMALINPIQLQFESTIFPIAMFLFGAFIVFNLATYTKSHISRTEGLVLVSVYVLFLFTEVLHII